MPIPYRTPSNEAARLAALDRLQILDTPRTADFDAVVAVATEVLGCPIGLITLLAQDRQWFKAETGLGLTGTPREVAFCNQAILGSEPLLVEDADRDERFCDNPLVTSGPGLRFYAGVPLDVDDGHKVGALCVIDTIPRQLPEKHLSVLKNLGRIVEGLINSHSQAVYAAEQAEKARVSALVAEDSLRKLTHKTKLLIQSERLAKIGSWEVDLTCKVVRWSDEVYNIYGIEIGAPISFQVALSFYGQECRSEAASDAEHVMKTGDPYEFEHEIETADGRCRWLRVIGNREMRDGAVVGIFGIVQDVTETRRSERLLWEAANFDALTAIPNRFHWNAKLAAAFEKASAAADRLTILILDLDGFKEINDTRGHAIGDSVLRELARRLTQSLPSGAFCARLGGDEFAVLLDDRLTKASVETMAMRVLADLRSPMILDGLVIQVSGTFGSATFPKDAATANELMKSADIALYQAKRSRRSSIVMFHKGIDGLFDKKCEALDLIHAALANGTLVPFYQPKVDLKHGHIIGFEALARICMADGTVIGPAQFAPALKDPVAAALIGARMLDQITTDMAAWRAGRLEYGSVALNLAESDFVTDLPARIASRLATLQLPVTSLQIEVTENVALVKDADAIMKSLRIMHASGIVVALDDFGTGFASLSHLRDLPLDCIKIDHSFVAGLGDASDNEIIVRSVIELGHRLGKTIVAEGVETQSQANLLRFLGCDIGQGFLFGRPVSRIEVEGLLRRNVARQTSTAGARSAVRHDRMGDRQTGL